VIDPAPIRARLEVITERIIRAGGHGVEVLAVTKTFPAAVIDAVAEAGCAAVGENYAQEIVAKWPEVTHRPRLHFIGQLQTNKVKALAAIVDVWETVDRPGLIAELAKRAPAARVLIQVDATGEPGKGGCAPDDALTLVDIARAAGLDVVGMMTVGPTSGPPAAAAPGFTLVRGLVDRAGLQTCSMGMSADFEIAVACGATQVRLGSALVGPRPSHAPTS
jgi:PLP dependent protein